MKIYFITNRTLIDKVNYISHAKKVSELVDFIIFREKDLYEYEAEELLTGLIKDINPQKIIVNKFINLACKLDIGGIHLSFEDFINLRTEISNKTRIGVSVHSPYEAMIINNYPEVEYIMYGHIFHTRCKEGVNPRGLDQLAMVRNAYRKEIVAVGGIEPEHFNMLKELGIESTALMSYFYR